jgi:hypothetical protein
MITPNEAEPLLANGKKVRYCIIHHATGMQFGGDFNRADAIEALRKADKLTLKTNDFIPVGHSLVVWQGGNQTYFATNEQRVTDFFKAQRTSSPA